MLRTCTVVALILPWPPATVAAAPSAEPVKLIFSIDQGFGNGIIVNADEVALRRIISALKSLRPHYDVYALFEPQVANKSNLNAALDLCAKHDLPFMFDVYSSDAMTLGTSTEQNAPADGPHGIAISVEDLARYKKQYGGYLAGLRMMEVFSQDFTVQAIRTTNPEWKGKGWVMPPDDFFQPALARPFLEFAKQQGMFVQFSDWHWLRFAEWDNAQKRREDALRQLLHEFPGIVTVTYANNEPNEASAPRLSNWEEAVAPFVQAGAKGIGLSNQAWLRRDETQCPVDDILAWAREALDRGCRMIQFEPVWYFFQLPRGSFGTESYVIQDKWRERGRPTPAFEALCQDLIKHAHSLRLRATSQP